MTTTNDTYQTGETPQKGDVVQLVNRTNLNYSILKYNGTYTVDLVTRGIKSTLVSVNGVPGVKASRFKLMKRANAVNAIVESNLIQFRIVSSNGQNVANAVSLKHLKSQLQKLLMENPGKSFDVYQYVSTAAAKMPEVEMFDRSAKLEKEPTPEKSEVNSPEMFTKL